MDPASLSKVKIRDLPEYGLFVSIATKRRGIILQWHRKSRKKWACVCFFLKSDEYPSEKKWVHADAVVFVSSEDSVLNRNKRGDAGDPWVGRWKSLLPRSRTYAKIKRRADTEFDLDQE